VSDKPNDGGPAFPSEGAYEYGMTLRDWFAGQITTTDGELREAVAAELMGEKAPVWTADNLMACVVWWAQARARFRYVMADAMLAARAISTLAASDISAELTQLKLAFADAAIADFLSHDDDNVAQIEAVLYRARDAMLAAARKGGVK